MLTVTSISKSNSNYEEVDFNKTVKLESLIDTTFVVSKMTFMNTKYGRKLVLIAEDGTNFYANDIIKDNMGEVQNLPVSIYITKKTNKDNTQEYTTCYIENERVSVKDYINQRLVIKQVKEIETKYGLRYVCVTDDRKEFMTNWKSLYDFYLSNKEAFLTEGCEVYPVIRHSDKTERDYVAFSDEPDETKQVKSSKSVSPLKKSSLKKNVSKSAVKEFFEPDEISDASVPF